MTLIRPAKIVLLTLTFSLDNAASADGNLGKSSSEKYDPCLSGIKWVNWTESKNLAANLGAIIVLLLLALNTSCSKCYASIDWPGRELASCCSDNYLAKILNVSSEVVCLLYQIFSSVSSEVNELVSELVSE